MSLEETEQLLRTHRITPNKLLGQNFMTEPCFYPKLCEYSSLGPADTVLDAGAGFGFLSRFLADRCKGVIAVEKDPQIAYVLREQLKDFDNVRVVTGDVLKVTLPEFNKVIAIPPYYLSSPLVEWLLKSEIDSGVLIMQEEFAKRLDAPIGSEDYGWLTVLVQRRMEISLLDSVPKEMFFPQPKVDSTIVRLQPLRKIRFEVKDEELFTQVSKWLFTQRNKKLPKAIAPFLRTKLQLNKQDAERIASSLPFREIRVRTMSPEQFGELTNAVSS